MERLYSARNGIIEKTRFFVSESAKPRKSAKSRNTLRKQEANRNHAIKSLARVLNNNFTSAAYLVSLTFDDDHLYNLLQSLSPEVIDRHAAVLAALDKAARNFIRRLRRSGAKDLAYVIVSSDMDGDTKNDARPHIHMIIMTEQLGKVNEKIQVAGKTLEELWKEGKLVVSRRLDSGDYSPLARYLLAQTRDIPNRKSYICSRNLERIIPDEYITDQYPNQPFEIPAGATILEWLRGGTNDESALMQYIRYIPSAKSQESDKQIPLPRSSYTCPK